MNYLKKFGKTNLIIFSIFLLIGHLAVDSSAAIIQYSNLPSFEAAGGIGVNYFDGFPTGTSMTGPFTLNGVTFSSNSNKFVIGADNHFGSPVTPPNYLFPCCLNDDFQLDFIPGINFAAFYLIHNRLLTVEVDVTVLDYAGHTFQITDALLNRNEELTNSNLFLGFSSNDGIKRITIDPDPREPFCNETVAIDDVGPSKVPEPSPVILFGSALAGLAVYARRKLQERK